MLLRKVGEVWITLIETAPVSRSVPRRLAFDHSYKGGEGAATPGAARSPNVRLATFPPGMRPSRYRVDHGASATRLLPLRGLAGDHRESGLSKLSVTFVRSLAYAVDNDYNLAYLPRSFALWTASGPGLSCVLMAA